MEEGGKKPNTELDAHKMSNQMSNVEGITRRLSMESPSIRKRDEDDVETDRMKIEWLNQNSFFHRGGGNDSSRAHTKGTASSFDKYSKVEDSKDIQKDESTFSKNTSQNSVEKSKDEKPKDVNSAGSIDELTRLLFKYHTNRYKEFKRSVYSLNDSDAKLGHHSDRHDSTESHPKSYRSNYSYRSSYSRERGNDRHKYKTDR